MRVARDYNSLYAAEADPWNVGDAAAPRYGFYRDLILRSGCGREAILDIGCGQGAPLARFRGNFQRLVGVDPVPLAVERARAKFPFAEFFCAPAGELPWQSGQQFDAIVMSDVICHIEDPERHSVLDWIDRHLAPGGVALIAAYAPGKAIDQGVYLFWHELTLFCAWHLAVESFGVLDTEHAWALCRKKRKMVALTVDYETWHPVPEGKKIDWQADVLDPAERLLSLPVPVTFMVETEEIRWLREFGHLGTSAVPVGGVRALEEQIARMPSVGLHFHPGWTPNGVLFRPPEWPNLAGSIVRAKDLLQEVSGHEVRTFRAAGYMVQPSPVLYDALDEADILADTSVVAGRVIPDRRVDFSHAYSREQPYFASRTNVSLKAPPAEYQIVELPIFAPDNGQMWFLDGDEAPKLAERLLRWHARPFQTSDDMRVDGHHEERLAGHDCYVATGHTKALGDINVIAEQCQRIRSAGFEFVTLDEMLAAVLPFLRASRLSTPRALAEAQIRGNYSYLMGDDRNVPQSRLLQERVPVGTGRVLDLACGVGTWMPALKERARTVVGIDYGADFVQKAKVLGRAEVLARADMHRLPFSDGAFDVVYADNTIEHAWDVTELLREIRRVLVPGGLLVAALPPDAYNPDRVCIDHTWKATPEDIRTRVEAAGFRVEELTEVDTRMLGQSPYTSSNSMMCYCVARRVE